jgi:2-isopropylmalate synthase
MTGIEVVLRDYKVRSISVGEDAQGEAQVEAEHNGKSFRGRGVSTDIIEASALAFLQVINRIALRREAGLDEEPARQDPKQEPVPAA